MHVSGPFLGGSSLSRASAKWSQVGTWLNGRMHGEAQLQTIDRICTSYGNLWCIFDHICTWICRCLLIRGTTFGVTAASTLVNSTRATCGALARRPGPPAAAMMANGARTDLNTARNAQNEHFSLFEPIFRSFQLKIVKGPLVMGQRIAHY